MKKYSVKSPLLPVLILISAFIFADISKENRSDVSLYYFQPLYQESLYENSSYHDMNFQNYEEKQADNKGSGQNLPVIPAGSIIQNEKEKGP